MTQRLEAFYSLHIGSLIFPQMDQMDLTGPFAVFSRIPGAKVDLIGKERTAVRDFRGLELMPTMNLAEAPMLDILHVPGGPGQEALMEDEAVLEFIRRQAAGARYVFSVCTGALVCGAAGLLQGRRATTHWASFHLLGKFGAVPTDRRVVADGNLITTAGVTAGIDGALTLVTLACGERAAQMIQLSLEYAPEATFNSGRPSTAPREVLEAVTAGYAELQQQRAVTAARVAKRLGLEGKE